MLAFIGGTGNEGLGLAARFAAAGEEIIIGSRNKSKAGKVARKIKYKVAGANVIGLENKEAAKKGSIIFLTVPYKVQKALLKSLKRYTENKIAVDVAVPLDYSVKSSAAEEVQKLLPKTKVVSAFKNLSSNMLLSLEKIECDVIVCSDFEDAKKKIMAVAEKIEGVRALDGGSLRNSRYVENMTALLLELNKRYKTETSIKIVGIT